jgi:hypothetical protein
VTDDPDSFEAEAKSKTLKSGTESGANKDPEAKADQLLPGDELFSPLSQTIL